MRDASEGRQEPHKKTNSRQPTLRSEKRANVCGRNGKKTKCNETNDERQGNEEMKRTICFGWKGRSEDDSLRRERDFREARLSLEKNEIANERDLEKLMGVLFIQKFVSYFARKYSIWGWINSMVEKVLGKGETDSKFEKKKSEFRLIPGTHI